MYKQIRLQHKSFFDMFEEGKDFPKQFDWDKAAEIIKKYEMKDVIVGLAEDWTYTNAWCLKDGLPVVKNRVPCLSSRWATPALSDNNNPNYTFECYKEVISEATKPDEWWTNSALKTLNFTQGSLIELDDKEEIAEFIEEFLDDIIP